MSLWSALSFRQRRPTEPPPRPSRTLFFWLTGTFILTLLPQVNELPVWISVVTVGALVVRAVLEIYRLPLPSTLFTSLVAICLFIGIILQFQTIAGREAGTALMAGLMAIKFYELRGPRDASVLIFSSLFIVMSALLYSQALELFVYCLIMTWLLTAILLRNCMGDRPDHELLPMLGQAGLILLQAAPLALFLFFFLPRYDGKLQIVLHDAAVGITDRVAPGSIARLASNDTLAMYVRFTGSAPAPETMYWRGLVLWQYENDGVWTPGKKGNFFEDPPNKEPGSTVFSQEITILPHNQPWLFALDYPTNHAVNDDDSGNWINSEVLTGGVLQLGPTQGRIDHTERYKVISASQLAPSDYVTPDHVFDDTRLAEAGLKYISESDALAGTELPADINPQVRALADQLHAAHPGTEAYVAAVFHYFRDNGFKYTSAPGTTPPGQDSLAYFLFTSKAGYCEHYASAFAVLMRLENIPARVIVGYQGADINPYNNIYTVLQSNAHSWDEVWIDAQKRWLRVDPTSTLPPSLSDFATNNPSQPAQDKPIQIIQRPLGFSEAYLPSWFNHALNSIEMRRQEIEVGWDDWVFSYNPNSQTQLAQKLHLGMGSFAFASAVAMVVCFLVFRRLMRQRVVISPMENLYARFCRVMAQRGIPRAKWEGPLAYTDRVAETFPEKKEAIQHLGSIVARSRYGPDPVDPATPRELQSLLTQIAAAQAATSSKNEP